MLHCLPDTTGTFQLDATSTDAPHPLVLVYLLTRSPGNVGLVSNFYGSGKVQLWFPTAPGAGDSCPPCTWPPADSTFIAVPSLFTRPLSVPPVGAGGIVSLSAVHQRARLQSCCWKLSF